MADRHTEIARRKHLRNRIQKSRTEINEWTEELVERRNRRIAAFLLSDALDLTDNIPVPGALAKVNNTFYTAHMEGQTYKVDIDAQIVYVLDNNKLSKIVQNKDLKPMKLKH